MSERRPYDRGQFHQRNKSEGAIKLDDRFDTEEISKSGHNLFKRRRLFEPKTTVGTTYVDSKIFDARFYKEKLFHLINRDITNNLLYKVLACVDPSKWHELCPETTITANATGDADEYEFDDGCWAFYKIQVKSSAATVELEAYASGQK
ncbi:unnamed protein product [marine sediment metagenome]|uniref:Uncharacterized protein n=1 Tax=marine sediment metagenome TaxID=412755 RepID=X1MDY9_9ZZZZ